jgi:hypothetical protein
MFQACKAWARPTAITRKCYYSSQKTFVTTPAAFAGQKMAAYKRHGTRVGAMPECKRVLG